MTFLWETEASTKVQDIAGDRIPGYLLGTAAGAQDEGGQASAAFVIGECFFDGEIGEDIAVIDEQRLAVDEIFDVFYTPTGLQPGRLVAEDNLLPSITIIGKFLIVSLREMMSIDNELIEPKSEEMIERESDERLLKNRNKRLGEKVGQWPKAGAKASAKNKSSANHEMEWDMPQTEKEGTEKMVQKASYLKKQALEFMAKGSGRWRAADLLSTNRIDKISSAIQTVRMEESSRTTPYDELPYPSAVFSQTHPGSIGVVARLSGLTPAPVERCRVLELGCGDGFNLLSMAYALPGSEFIGVDLASQPIARGTAILEKLGLKNIALHALDVADIGEDFGGFDYILAHGLFSWVPEHVRKRILEICHRHLNAQGVVYISYNAYPGNHLRDLVRGMMRYHSAHFPRPTDQIAQSRGLIKLLSQAGEKEDPYRQILERELDRIQKYTDAGFFHDDLSAVNQPFYFHEFTTQAAQNGLQFLGEAAVSEKQALTYPPPIQTVLDGLDPADVIGGEQYRDFLRCRAFRQTLLCHAGIAIDHQLDARHFDGIYLAGEILPASGEWNVHSEKSELFLGANKSEFETSRPFLKAAFARIAARWPQFISTDELWLEIKHDLGERERATSQDFSSALLQIAIAGGLTLLTYRPPFLLELTEKPTASALARLEIETSNRVSTMRDDIVEIKDELARLLLRLLDGTRDRPALLLTLQKTIDEGGVQTDPSFLTLSAADLERELQKLARMALLVA